MGKVIATEDQVVRLARQGVDARNIATRLGCSTSTVWRLLRRNKRQREVVK